MYCVCLLGLELLAGEPERADYVLAGGRFRTRSNARLTRDGSGAVYGRMCDDCAAWTGRGCSSRKTRRDLGGKKH